MASGGPFVPVSEPLNGTLRASWAQSLGRCELKERPEVMEGSVEGMGMGWNTLRPRLLTTGLWDNASSPGTSSFLKNSFIEL